jgi:hypothetical protein
MSYPLSELLLNSQLAKSPLEEVFGLTGGRPGRDNHFVSFCAKSGSGRNFVTPSPETLCNA